MKYLILITMLAAMFIVTANDQPPRLNGTGQYSLTKQVVSSGGAEMVAGPYKVTATIGQVDASMLATGNPYQVKGGFWATSPSPHDIIFKDDFE